MLWWILRKMRSSDPSARAKAAATLGESRDPRAFQTLLTALTDVDSHVRDVAVQALGSFGDKGAVTALTKALKDENPTVRSSAACALARLRDARAIPALTAALEDGNESPTVRCVAAYALGELGDARVIPTLMASLQDGDIKVCLNVAVAIKRLRSEPVPGDPWDAVPSLGWAALKPLLTALKKDDPKVQRRVVEALREIGNAALEPLRGMLVHEKSERLRYVAADVYVRIADPQARDIFDANTQSMNSDLRNLALYQLACRIAGLLK